MQCEAATATATPLEYKTDKNLTQSENNNNSAATTTTISEGSNHILPC